MELPEDDIGLLNDDEDQLQVVILQGYAIKVGSILGGNAKRYFVLMSDFTIFSSLTKDTAFSPTKRYSLHGCHVEWGQLASKEYAVRIDCRKQSSGGKVGKKKKLTLIVDDESRMKLWVSGLRCLFAGTKRILCSENEIGGSTCAICLTDFEENEDLVVLPCEHRFCSDGCIDRWLTISSKCPLCKQDCTVHGEPMLRRGKWQTSLASGRRSGGVGGSSRSSGEHKKN